MYGKWKFQDSWITKDISTTEKYSLTFFLIVVCELQ